MCKLESRVKLVLESLSKNRLPTLSCTRPIPSLNEETRNNPEEEGSIKVSLPISKSFRAQTSRHNWIKFLQAKGVSLAHSSTSKSPVEVFKTTLPEVEGSIEYKEDILFYFRKNSHRRFTLILHVDQGGSVPAFSHSGYRSV